MSTVAVDETIGEIEQLRASALRGELPLEQAIANIASVAEGTGDRRARGSFFTPDDVTAYIASASVLPALWAGAGCGSELDDQITCGADLLVQSRETIATLDEASLRRLDASLRDLTVLDPTCGAGAFLVAAAAVLAAVDRAVHERWHELGLEERSPVSPYAGLRGCDILPLAVRACHAVLELAARRDGFETAPGVVLVANATQPLPFVDVDVVVGNPPYVRRSPELAPADLATAACGNLYAWVTERALAALRPGGRCGFIVPISAVCTDAFQPYRALWRHACDHVWTSHFDTIPSTLFPGTVQRVSIFLGRRRATDTAPGATDTWHTTAYRKWRAADRAQLMSSVRYVPLPPQQVAGSLAKVGTTLEAELLARLFTHPPAGELLATGETSNRFWYKRRWSYFLLFLDFVPEIRDAAGELRLPSEFKPVDVHPSLDARVLLAAYNSSLFYWFFTVFSDNRNVNRRDLAAFPFAAPQPALAGELCALADELMQALRDSSEQRVCTYRSIGTITNTYFRQASTKPVLDEIDALLARHYGLTAEQLAFVQAFEAGFRVGGRTRE